jgi:hypothetical protein
MRAAAVPERQECGMALLHRTESSCAPLAAHGRTITLVTRTRAMRVVTPSGAALHVRARPSHVEVLDEHGRHEVVRIRDIEGTLMAAIVCSTIAAVITIRALKRSR